MRSKLTSKNYRVHIGSRARLKNIQTFQTDVPLKYLHPFIIVGYRSGWALLTHVDSPITIYRTRPSNVIL